MQARARFKAAIEATPTPRKSQESFLPRHVRAALNEVDFVDLWHYWWEEASDIHAQCGDDRHAARIYNKIVDRATTRRWTLGPEFLDMQALVKRLWKTGRLAYTTWPSPKCPGLPQLPHNVSSRVFGGITKNPELLKRVGRYHYDEETISTFWDEENRLSEEATADFASEMTSDPDLYMDTTVVGDTDDNAGDPGDEGLDEVTLRDLYGEVDLETYGPFLQPLDYGAWDLDITNDQRCSICLEALGAIGVKISACGHYLHLRCIQKWMNETSPNANRCSECRAQICATRRKVRHAVEDESDKDYDSDGGGGYDDYDIIGISDESDPESDGSW
jgi:hypothetical protein